MAMGQRQAGLPVSAICGGSYHLTTGDGKYVMPRKAKTLDR